MAEVITVSALNRYVKTLLDANDPLLMYSVRSSTSCRRLILPCSLLIACLSFKNMDCMCRVDDGCFVEQDISLFSLYHAAVVAHVFLLFSRRKADDFE